MLTSTIKKLIQKTHKTQIQKTKLKNKRVYVFNNSAELVKMFNSISDAASFLMDIFPKYTNFDSLCNSISRHCARKLWHNFNGYFFSFNETIYIPNLCVDKSLRGKKIGTKLLGYYIKQMEEAGFNKFALDCLLHNLPAKNLYHSLGFKEMKLMNGFDGKGSKVDVVCFLRKKGDYLPEEFN